MQGKYKGVVEAGRAKAEKVGQEAEGSEAAARKPC